MQLFKNIGVQSILTNRSFRSKVTIMLKYQIEINDKIWVLYCRETRTYEIMIGDCWNEWGIKEMHFKSFNKTWIFGKNVLFNVSF